jgi:hypothetical protein
MLLRMAPSSVDSGEVHGFTDWFHTALPGVLARNFIKIYISAYNLEWHFDVGLLCV